MINLIIGMLIATSEPVYVADTNNRIILHCKCVELPDFRAYCLTDGWDWEFIPGYRVFESPEKARKYLLQEYDRQIQWAQESKAKIDTYDVIKEFE